MWYIIWFMFSGIPTVVAIVAIYYTWVWYGNCKIILEKDQELRNRYVKALVACNSVIDYCYPGGEWRGTDNRKGLLEAVQPARDVVNASKNAIPDSNEKYALCNGGKWYGKTEFRRRQRINDAMGKKNAADVLNTSNRGPFTGKSQADRNS